MAFDFARIGAVVAMDVGDYFQQGKKWWFRLHEKGGKQHELPAHHKAEEFMDAYLEALRVLRNIDDGYEAWTVPCNLTTLGSGTHTITATVPRAAAAPPARRSP